MKARPHQAMAVKDIWRYLSNATGDPVAVLPTGSGKSLVSAIIAREIHDVGRRMLVLAPKKELIEQSYQTLLRIAPDVDAGICCAGLNRKDTDNAIIFATVQSIYRRALDFGLRHLVLVDEAHGISKNDDTMYSQLLEGLRINNPKLRKVGLTATPYRLESSYIYGEDQPFDDVCHETSVRDMLDAGYISPIVSASVKTISMKGVKTVRGDFDRSAMSSVFCDKVIDAATETVEVANAKGRKSCLVFGTGVDHAYKVAEAIRQISGDEVEVIEGNTPPIDRAATITRFRAGQLRWVVNCDVLTTGFDAPNIDLISVMRATQSPGLFYQIVGRGFRICEGKEDCLLLDFGGNLARHGALDSDDYGKAALEKKNPDAVDGEAPTKECPSCHNSVHAASTVCPECGHRFPPPELSHDNEAESFAPAMLATAPGDDGGVQTGRRIEVTEVQYALHKKRNAGPTDPRTLRVNYTGYEVDAGGNRIDAVSTSVVEWVCVEHTGFARNKALTWWSKRSSQPCPDDADQALYIANNGGLHVPGFIDVEKQGEYDRIVAYTAWKQTGQWVTLVEQMDQDELPF